MGVAQGVEAAGIPEGFVARHAGGPFLEPIGPIFRRPEEAGARFGIRIERRHCNNQAVAHGGMLATIADIYLAPAPLGAWLECHPALLRRTSRMMFVEGRFLADGVPVLRASGVFSLPRPKEAASGPAG